MIDRLSLVVGSMLVAMAPCAALAASQATGSSIAGALKTHRWTLQSASDGAGRPIEELQPTGHRIVMEFDGSRLAVHGACNQMNGNWRLGPRGELLVGRLAATMRACEAPLMRADEALSAALAKPMRVALTPGAAPTLRLSSATRQALTFGGEPTLRSLYGPPTRLFLEVAARTIDCTLPSGAVGSCLQVRDVHFDPQGLRRDPPGPWRALAEPIEGFEHVPGVRNVLRVDRYERKPAPAGGATVRYVLDLMVESETVGTR